ncbi:MAG: RNA polymerase sigma factor, partial [Bacteroidota bacterium]
LYYLSLFQYGLSKGYSRELVEDSIQDLFITLWDSRQSLSQVSHVKSYLFLALRHRLNRTNLNNQRQKTWLDKIFSSSISEDSHENMLVYNENNNQIRREIKSVISYLAPRQKEMVQLKFYENFDNDRIAEIMGISKQGVANLLVRTLKDLKKAWKQLHTFFI